MVTTLPEETDLGQRSINEMASLLWLAAMFTSSENNK